MQRSCPHCSAGLTIADTATADQVMACPTCGQAFRVGGEADPAPVVRATPRTTGGSGSPAGMRRLADRVGTLTIVCLLSCLLAAPALALAVIHEVRYQRAKAEAEAAIEQLQHAFTPPGR